jgi:cardiolipin synthase A/B
MSNFNSELGSTDEQLFVNSDDFFNAVKRDIQNAQQSIDVETYIFEIDVLGEELLNLLGAATQRGVHVRLLVDAFGSARAITGLRQRTKVLGINFNVYRPIWNHLINGLFSYVNHRDHRKIWIFDAGIGYVGSMNISGRHLSSLSSGEGWKDFGLRFTDHSRVALLQRAFQNVWREKPNWKKLIAAAEISLGQFPKPLPVRLNETFPRRLANHREFLHRIRNAQQRVWLANAYFLPEPGLVKALCRAARRGTDVRILVSAQSDVFGAPWVAAVFYPRFLRNKVKVFEYIPSIMHAKACIIDDWAVLGSSNLNYRSLLHNLEADVELQNEENKDRLRSEMITNFAQSTQITNETFAKLSWYKKAVAYFILLFKYWL